MKKRVLAGIVIVSTLFFSCKKEDLSHPVLTSSQWQYSGVTYYGETTEFSGGSLLSEDKGLNDLEIIFLGRPTENGTYTVSGTGPNSSTECVIEGSYLSATLPAITFRDIKSTGAEGNTVSVSVSATNKITATFKNVAVADGPVIKYVTGTLVEE